MRYIRTLLILLVVAVLFQGCYSTSVSASWMSEKHHPRNFKKLLVIGMSTNVAARATFEDELVYFMRLKGINAISASSVLPPDRSVVSEAPEAQKKRLLDGGYDGVFAISLLEKNNTTKYVSGTTTYAPMSFYGGYYGSFYSYYPHMYSNVYQPGYYAASQEIILNSSLFDAETGDLLWSAQSQTSDPSSVDNAANSYAKSMVTQILKRKVIIPNAGSK
jgi:hypothetical protein